LRRSSTTRAGPWLQSDSHSTSRDEFQLSPHVVLPLPFECEIELPLPQISGLAANVMRTVPFETRATLLAIVCAGAVSTAPARAARTTAVVPASDVILNVFIC
jgi:hypothetical protein